MDPFEHLAETPDLNGQVRLLSYRPTFIGPYSCVYRGRLRYNGEIVAIKVLNAVEGAALHTMQRRLRRERRAWGALSHPNILPLYGFADDEEMFQPFGALVSPWLQRGDSTKFLAEHGDSLSIEDRMNLWKDVIAGVEYLHTYQPLLVHGDLKPRNILIDDSGRAQICDFGLVRIFLNEGSSGMTTTTHHTGTERYLASELVFAGEDAAPTTASDVYALGCIGLEFIFSQAPYSSRKNNLGGMIYVDIKAGVPPGKRPPNLLPHLQDTWAILDSCWEQDPHGRPDAVQLRAWLRMEMRQSQIRDGTPLASTEGAQLNQPSVMEGEGGQEDPASFTLSGISRLELVLPLEPKSPLQNLSGPPSSTPTSNSNAAPATTGTHSQRSWIRRKLVDPIARAPPPRPSTHLPKSPSYQQRLQQRFRKYQCQSTFTVDCRDLKTGLYMWKISIFLGSTKISESGWFTNKDAAKEEAAMRALIWLNTYGYP